jgi:hypothetical protein
LNFKLSFCLNQGNVGFKKWIYYNMVRNKSTKATNTGEIIKKVVKLFNTLRLKTCKLNSIALVFNL